MSNAPAPWDAEFSLDAEGVRNVLSQQFPDLPLDDLTYIGHGWDNDVWRLHDLYTFRFPRRTIAVTLLEHERNVLPQLLPHLPLPTPELLFLGEPSPEFPHLFQGYRYLPGTTACRAELTREQRAQHIEPLARFLKTLHSLDATTAPITDTLGRADISKRLAWFTQELPKIAHLYPNTSRVLEQAQALASTLETLPEASACWVHGDLYPRHLLVDEDHNLSGVIDWGDVHVGDPAIDLSIAFTHLHPQDIDAFFASYGATPSLQHRALFLALRSAIALLAFGTDINAPELVALARWTFRSWELEAKRLGL